MGSIYFLYMDNLLNSIDHIAEKIDIIPDNIQKEVIKLFRENFKNPEFLQKILVKIQEIPSAIEREKMLRVIERISHLNSDVQNVMNTIHKRISWLQASMPQMNNPRI